MLPVEVNLDAYRFAKQNDLSAVMYHDLMMDNIDEVTDKRIRALKEIEKDKARVARAYNKKVKSKSFQIGDLVWQTILPIGTKSNQFGKWSPNWKGPFYSGQNHVWKFIYARDNERRMSHKGNQREVSKEIFPKCLARSLVLSKQWPIHVSPLEQK